MKNKSAESKINSHSADQTAAHTQPAGTGCSILLVDDDTVLAELWQSYLNTQGYLVDCCGTVADATVLMHSKHYDLLIVDIFLRQDGQILAEGGVTLINRVRMQDGFNDASDDRMSILAVTGAGTNALGKSAALHSVNTLTDASLQKPIKLDTLGREVARLCQVNG